MVGKLFLFALVCVSFAQGLGLEEAIKRGLARTEDLDRNGKARIEGALKEVNYKSDLINRKTEDYVQRASKTVDGVREALRSIALETEKKAKESNAPKSVFECIRREEATANSQAESLAKKFEADIRALEKAKRAEIKADTKPLDGMEQSLEVRYQEAVKMISSCQDEDCVHTNVNSFARCLDMLFADIRRILSYVSTTLEKFYRDATTFNENIHRQIPSIEGTGARNIRTCLEGREALPSPFFREN